MTIKDLKKGDKAYILTENRGRNTKIKIEETNVLSVGRMYVTVGESRWQYKFMNWNPDCLIEKVNCGEARLLFKTYTDAENYMQKKNLALWLGCISVGRAEKYSLEQLRKVKEILGD